METTGASDRARLRDAFATRDRVGWVLYDWANSAFVLCVVTVVGAAYFVGVYEAAAEKTGAQVGGVPALSLLGVDVTAEAAWSFIIAIGAFTVAVSSPFLGTIADASGTKKRFLQAFCLLGAFGTALLWFPLPWWAVGLLILVGVVGFEESLVFYNAFLPEIAAPREQDVVSSAGYAAGYIGGVVVLIASLVLYTPFLLEEPVGSIRNSFLLVGLWWAGFALVTFALLPERAPRRRLAGVGRALVDAWRELSTTVRNVAHYPQAALFLLAFLMYNDGVATLISNATPFALQNIYLDRTLTEKITLAQLIPAIIMIQLIAAPGAMLFGWLSGRFGEKAAIYGTLSVFIGVLVYSQVILVVSEFYVVSALIGLVLGGIQAISRALFARFVPAGKNAQFFAFFALSQKFSAMGGPLIYGLMLLLTGQTRTAILSLLVLFVLGGAVLFFVDVQKGQADARRG